MLRGFFPKLAAVTLGLAGLMATAPTAQAAFFEYTSTVTIDSNNSPSAGIITGGGANATITAAGNSFTLTAGNSTVGIPHLATPTDIVPLALSENAGGTSGTILDFNYTLTITIQDFASASATVADGTGTIAFMGRVQGTIGGNSSLFDQISFVPNPALVLLSPTANQLLITLQSFAAPGPNSPGAVTLRVRSVPEPGSIALLGIGLVGALGVLGRRKLSRKA